MVFTRRRRVAGASCPPAPCSWPPAPRRTSPTRRSTRARSARREAEVLPGLSCRASSGRGAASDAAEFRLEPDPNGFFTSHDTDGQFVTYYGDNHPRYAGNVVKAMASAKDGYRARRRAVRRRDRGARSRPTSRQRESAWQSLVARLDDELLARGRAGRPAHADDRRGDRARAGGGPALPPRPVLPAAELRAAQPARPPRRSRRVAADGGHRADRRVGRPREGPAVADHPRDGRVEPAVRVPEAGRAGRRDGPDRHADRDPRGLSGAARRRRPRQRRAVLDRQGAQGAGQPRDLLRRLQEGRRPVQARGDRGGHRPGDLDHRHRRRRSRRGGRRTRTSAATSSRRWWRTPTASSARRSCRSRT